jgi:hypothetical protein
MATIKSNHNAPLPFPVTGTILNPGAQINVDRWDVVKNNDTVRAWLAAKIIEVVDEQKAEAKPAAKKS